MSATAKTVLVFIEGNFNSSRYINEVLTPHMCHFCNECQLPSFYQISLNMHSIVNNVHKMVLQCLQIYHVLSMLWLSLGELFHYHWSKTAHCKIFFRSCKKNGAEFHISLSGKLSTLPRTESMNASVIMVVSRIIDFLDTFNR